MSTKTTDDAVLELLAKVKQKRTEIQSASKRASWQTSCVLGYNPDSATDRVNIATIREPAKIVELYSFIQGREDYWAKANADLGLNVESSYMGYSFSAWKTDLKIRAEQLNVDQKKRDLEALDKRINGLVTPEQRRTLELEAIQKELAEKPII